MNDYTDYKQDIDKWADMWDEMQDKCIHPDLEKPKLSAFASSVLEDKPSDSYYDYLETEEELFSEEKDVITTQNPVRMDTVGPDQEYPDPSWNKEDFLNEIEKLKNRLFDLENKLARMGQGKKFSETPINVNDKKLIKKIENIKDQINSLSNELGVKDDPSPYKVKKRPKKSR
jgi:hypothetical protein